MKWAAKRAFYGTLERLGLLHRKLSGTLIIAYHRVHPKHFDEQMRILKARHHVVSMAEALGDLSKPQVVITFDDGYRDIYRHAYPVLKRLGLPATVFVTTAYAETNPFAWWDRLEHKKVSADFARLKSLPPEELERQVQELTGLTESSPKPTLYDFASWAELTEMKEIISVGSHTATHPILTTVSESRVREELGESRHTITQKMGIAPTVVAYPNGDHTEQIRAIAKQTGYEAGVGYDRGVNDITTDRYGLHRRGINIKDTPALFAAKIGRRL